MYTTEKNGYLNWQKGNFLERECQRTTLKYSESLHRKGFSIVVMPRTSS